MSKTFTAEGIAADFKQQGFSNIPGIGKLTVKESAARQGRNPATGATISIPAKKSVKFSASKTIKDALNA
jgi:DNA-binding protein HU-beta